nr:unnamed protein product [Leishmania braziliensis]
MQDANATGYVAGTVGPSASSAAQQSTASSATTANVVTAADGTVMLAAPLGLQSTVLSQPSFFPSLGEDFGDVTEEGDILFPILGDPWSRVRRGQSPCRRLQSTSTTSPPQSPPAREAVTVPVSLCFSTTLCMQPVLTLPRRMGVLMAREVFRALMCFHNAADYSLKQANFHVGVGQPSASLRQPLMRRTVATLKPKSNYTIIAAVPLSEASTYALSVAVDYCDPSGRQRQLTWSTTFKAEQSIMEVQPRCLRYVRPIWTADTQADVAGDYRESELRSSAFTRAYAHYQLSIGLKNMSSVPLHLVASEWVLPSLTNHRGAAVFCEVMGSDGRVERARLQNSGGTTSARAGKSDTPAPVLLMPGDTHSLLFKVGILLEELRHPTVVHGRGGVMTRLLSPRLASLGHVEWAWCRANGETGAAQSALLRVEQLLAEAEVELLVTHVTAESAAHPSTPPPSSKATAAEVGDAEAADRHHHLPYEWAPSAPLLAGSPVTAHFTVLNHSNVQRYDVAVKVRVERLAPQWLYTGPTVRPLGLLGPASSLAFSLTLLPWQAGWLNISRDAIELVDARMSETVLWPPPEAAVLQPVLAKHDAALGGAASSSGYKEDANDGATLAATAPAIAAVPMKALPAADANLLCNALVL